MQSEQPTGYFWRLKSKPWLWAAILPAVSLVLTALAAGWFLFPLLPQELRDQFESVHRQANSGNLTGVESGAVDRGLARLANATKAGEITVAECGAALQELRAVVGEHSMAVGVFHKYVVPAKVDDQTLAEAANTIRRYCHALHRGLVTEEDAAATEGLARTEGEAGRSVLKDELDQKELQEVLTAMTDVADRAGVPAEIPPTEIAVRIQRIVDETLRGG